MASGPLGDDLTREWPVPLPQEHALIDRVLEARDSAGDVVARWRYNGGSWTVIERPPTTTPVWTAGPPTTTPVWTARGIGLVGFADLFDDIVAGCVRCEWSLWSLPRSPIAGPSDPCQSPNHCGNAAVTTRHDGRREVRLCEGCAAEHDERGR